MVEPTDVFMDNGREQLLSDLQSHVLSQDSEKGLVNVGYDEAKQGKD